MSNQMKINTSSLSRDAGQVDMYIRKMKSEMGKMKSSVADMDRMWTGREAKLLKKRFRMT